MEPREIKQSTIGPVPLPNVVDGSEANQAQPPELRPSVDGEQPGSERIHGRFREEKQAPGWQQSGGRSYPDGC